jgi:NhaP-type Na+/H+ or K+/H+ antiporter
MKYEEDISIIKLLCFALYGFGELLQKEMLSVVGLFGVIAAFIWSTIIFCKYWRFKSEKEKKLLVQSMHSFVFCILYFVLFYFSFNR